jgi:hypothetical protein
VLEKGAVVSPRAAELENKSAPSTPTAAASSVSNSGSSPDAKQQQQSESAAVTPASPPVVASPLFFPEIEDELKRISAFRTAEENASANITQ